MGWTAMHASTRAHTRPRRERSATAATVFGLDVRSALRMPFLEHARAAPTGRVLRIGRRPQAGRPATWHDGARTICSQSRSDGPISFRIEAHPHDGYELWGRAGGSYLLSLDGHELWCDPGDHLAHSWERFLVGQVLPFAALVGGLEIFHASAVVLDGRAIAFAGPSGAGKTSLALELCRRGAGFFADDVLGLEARASELIAHPGAPVAAVDPHAIREPGDTPAGGTRLSCDGGELVLRVDGASSAVPLGALFFLDRPARGEIRRLCFEPVEDARLLLASTFNFVLDTPQRMRGLLDVCSLAAQRPVERIEIPPSLDAAGLAEAVLRRVAGLP